MRLLPTPNETFCGSLNLSQWKLSQYLEIDPKCVSPHNYLLITEYDLPIPFDTAQFHRKFYKIAYYSTQTTSHLRNFKMQAFNRREVPLQIYKCTSAYHNVIQEHNLPHNLNAFSRNIIQLVNQTVRKMLTLTLHVVGSGDLNSRGRWPGAGGTVHSLFHVVSKSRVGTPNIAYPSPLSIIRYYVGKKGKDAELVLGLDTRC